jgi:hypothetical protein
MVKRLLGSAGTVNLEFSTKDRTATSETDYEETCGTLVFQPGEMEK